ncbi:heptaprenyl diphosphate synthase component 1 [Paenibacillus apiarius]|uniref:Heptaprenyl diphosphate synthase component 1 n=1 Tax=Paenibacillus apiarius TaxID=46240 RepID=A0ABT4DS86_9BACL|nr:heptaprenyl diphosphate synthase component 1 [Paenibacillus apiarius]MBN3527631.1 heptaprenyl diphosphate synthase component 1 [Paenibacillus apiarius]MCY9517119.1 heptaprenyl diphosphate synthase component 1 [Paenibacillus apiarius]MCY9520184.1 heptaprenyl diphosphate synthase component 1 [Paenibacillus apiarius]MCY9554928.1 heptaprenyl diphosphate synthase component 1 [Paenibacillus apiarius]MCY9561439.1 heptaprenyl diphosphate synthase component 1 [Paenibacillus apiarius]
MKANHISQLAQRYVEHDMIQAHTDLPAFPNARAELLFAFLDRSKPADDHSELYALVTSLVQVGLDTHDMIEMASVQGNDRNLRSRQLKVLAGDYFSSRFYNLLAQAGQIEAIQSLSLAVCNVNRLKMTMVDKMKQWTMTAEEYLRTCVSLKKMLFQSFNDRLSAKDVPAWEVLLDHVTELEVMEQEKERAEHFGRFVGSWSYWHVWQQGTEEERRKLKQSSFDVSFWHTLMSKYEVREQLAYQVRAAQDKLQTIVSALPVDSATKQRLGSFLGSIHFPLAQARSASVQQS